MSEVPNVREGRLNEPVASVSNGEKAPATQNGSGLGHAFLPQWMVVALTVMSAVSGVVLGLPAMGVALPPIVLAIAGAVISVGVALGIASPGIRKKE